MSLYKPNFGIFGIFYKEKDGKINGIARRKKKEKRRGVPKTSG